MFSAFASALVPAIRPAVCALLSSVLVLSPLVAGAQPRVSHRAKKVSSTSLPKLTAEQRALHALDRMTFGPRPGDVAAVEQMGVDRWFERQLHPETIADTALDARLAKYPAMRLSQTELVERFPTPAMLRNYSRGGLVAPEDEVERAVYADAALNYEDKKLLRKESKENKDKTVPVPGNAGVSAGLDGAGGRSAGAAVAGGVAPIVRMNGALPWQGATQPVVRVDGVSPGMMAGEDQPVLMSVAARNALLNMPPAARLQRMVAMRPEAMVSLQASLKGPEQERLYAGMTPEQAELAAAMKTPERLVTSEVLSTRLLRDVYSERQVQGVMADFWLNHFSVYLHKNQNEPYLLPAYEREAILPHALGKFEDLLRATAESPAMLVYLDNWESVGPDSKAALRAAGADRQRPGQPGNGVANVVGKVGKKRPQGINENYARELMELHTLGVKGGYTQQDVIEVAKCFTGWTIDRPANGGEFLFNPNRHEPGDKVVLGHTIHEDGMNEGLEVLHILATSPATAHFVSEKLAERFVSDVPPAALVDRMAATFLKTDGDTSAVLTTMFRSPEFWSPAVYRAKVKTPLEFVTSALRATNADVTNPLPLVQAMDRLGMPVYGMQTPNGYSWQAADWVSSNALLTRMNFALVLSGNRLPGTRVAWPALLHLSGDPGTVPDPATEGELEMALLGEPAAAKTREAALAGATMPGVQQQAEQSFRELPVSHAGPNRMERPFEAGVLRVKAGRAPVQALPETPLATDAGLLLGSPDFQRR